MRIGVMRRADRQKHTCLLFLAVLVSLAAILSSCGTAAKEEEALKGKGIDEMVAGSYETAVKTFDRALAEAGGHADAGEVDIAYYKAAAQILAGDEAGAEKTYSGAVTFDPEKPEAYYLRGCLYARSSNLEKADADFQNALKYRAKDDYELYFRVYAVLTAAGDQNAGAVLDEVLKTDGTDGALLTAKGRVYETRGDTDSAVEYYKKAEAKGDTSAYFYDASLSAKEGDSGSADAALKSYEKAAGDTAEGRNAAGLLKMQEKDYDSALQEFEKGIELSKDSSAETKQVLLKNQIAALEYTADFSSAKDKAAAYLKKYPTDQEMVREYSFLETR